MRSNYYAQHDNSSLWYGVAYKFNHSFSI